MQRRRILPFIVLFLSALLLFPAACGQEKPIRVGFVACLSGRGSILGIAGRNGLSLAIEEANRNGGINGRPLDLLTRDICEGDAAYSSAVKDLADNDVRAIVGPMTSSRAAALIEQANAANVPLIGPTVSSTTFSNKDDMFLRLPPPLSIETAGLAKYLRRIGIESAVCVFDLSNSAYTQEWYLTFRQAFTALGGGLTAATTFHSGQVTSFLHIAKVLMQTSPECILIAAGAIDSAMICQQLKKLHYTGKIAIATWSMTDVLLHNGGRAVENAIFSNTLSIDTSTDEFKAFYETFIQRFHVEPDFASIAAYSAGLIIIEALKSGGAQSGSLKESMLNQRHEVFRHEIKFNKYGEILRTPEITTIRNGHFVPVGAP